MQVHERLTWARMQLGKYRTASDAARAMGVPTPTYAGHENGSRGLTVASTERYAKFFRVSPEWMLYARGEPRAGVRAPAEDDGAEIEAAVTSPQNVSEPTPIRSSMGGRLPIRGRGAAAEDGSLVMDAREVGSVPMPAALDGVPDAYGVFVHGDSMLERYEAGELLHVHPHRPVKKGDYVVAQIRQTDGSIVGFVKRFISRSPRQLVLEQLNPPEGEERTMRFPGETVLSVHKVIGTGEP